jgi:hypothetical protein
MHAIHNLKQIKQRYDDMPFYFFAAQVEPQRSIANIRLPCAGLPAICALQHPSAGSGNAFEGGGAASSLSGQSDVATLPEDADEVGQ